MTTGERMKARRKAIGLSAEKVAEELGVSAATIYRYEKGDIEKVPGNILWVLSDTLRTTPAYLMGWSDNPEPSAQLQPREAELAREATTSKAFNTLLYCAGFSESLDDDGNWTVYRGELALDMDEEKASRIMAQTLQFFEYLVEKEKA